MIVLTRFHDSDLDLSPLPFWLAMIEMILSSLMKCRVIICVEVLDDVIKMTG
jgi:hypothetical protein